MDPKKRKALLWTAWPIGGVLGFALPFFLTWSLVFGVGDALGWDADAAMDRSPILFAALLGLAFGLGGLGLGLVQWFFVRRHLQRSTTWVLGVGFAFFLIGPIYIMIWELVGEEIANTPIGRIVTTTLIGLITGPIAGWVMWRYSLAQHGHTKRDWLPYFTLAMIASGVVANVVEIALNLGGGDASPLGILVFGLITLYAWQRLPPGDRESVPWSAPQPYLGEKTTPPRN